MGTASYTSTRTIAARTAGHDSLGRPLPVSTYVIDRDPEDWGDGRSRIFAENRSVRSPRGGFAFTPQIVLTDSIADAAVVVDANTGERLTPLLPRLDAEAIASAPSVVGRRVRVEAVA